MKQSLLKRLVRECVHEILAEGVTTFLSNTAAAKHMATKIWQDSNAKVDIHRTTDAFDEYTVRFDNYPTQFIRHYKNNEWFVWIDAKKEWKHADKYKAMNEDEKKFDYDAFNSKVLQTAKKRLATSTDPRQRKLTQMAIDAMVNKLGIKS